MTPLTREEWAELMGLLREHCYAEGGHPPRGWSLARDGSILKQLAKHAAASEIAAAIQGLSLLQASGEVAWLGAVGTPMTLRCLYASRSGVTPMFELARAAFHKAQQRPAPKALTPRTPSLLADVLSATIRSTGPSPRAPRTGAA